MKHLFLLLVVTAAGCAQIQQKLDPNPDNVFYKRDVKIIYGDKTFTGAAVLPRAALYKFQVQFADDANLTTVDTCHKNRTNEDFSLFTKRKIEFEYTPVAGIEDGESCPMDIGGYSVSGRHSWGFIDFEHPALELWATIKCNGKVLTQKGVSVCQAKVGTIQQIIFGEVTRAAKQSDPKCNQMESKDGKVFEYRMSREKCVHVFQGVGIHRHTTLGFERILVRGN